MHPAYVYAFEVCGYAVTAETRDRFTPEELERWEEAIDEWCSLHPDEPEP